LSQSPRPTVLLLSSDVRRRYAEDILTALALPDGALIQFRYDAGYVAPALQRRIADHSILDEQCLIGFVSGVESGSISEMNPSSCFFLPIRLADIVSADPVGDFFVLRLRVKSYPNLGDWPLENAAELFADGKKFIGRLIESNGGYCPATIKFPDPRVNDDGDQAQLWLGVVRRLVSHPTFSGSYFLRVEPPLFKHSHGSIFDLEGRLSLTDRQSARLQTTFYSKGYSEEKRIALSCSTDGRFLRVSSDDTYDVALRYDTVEFWLQPNAANFDALARVTLTLGTIESASVGDSSLTTHVQLPVLVRRSRSTLVLRVMTSAVGAFLVALPAILGPSFPVRLRVLSAVIGALLIAFAAIVIPRSGGQ
jgi:hypothetical protein